MRKRVKSSLLVLLMLILAGSLLVGCENKPDQPEEKQQTYVFLGDSIAEALLGPSPITERDSYGYYSIIGQINGAKYVNRAISGLTSNGFVNSLCQRGFFEEDDGFFREYWIKEADVIFISMLGNDVLCNDMIEFAIETGKASTAAGEIVLSEDYQNKLNRRCIPNMREGMARIYELNPDVTVVWQTLYNPFFDASVLIDEEDWAWYNDEIEKGNVDEKYTFRALADILVNAMNDVVYDYKRDNSDKKFYISDVKGAFDAVFEQGDEKGAELIFSDCIHPSTQGHALIAETLEKTLCELGLSSMDTATEKYKTVVSDRASRLYPENVSVRTAIREATDFSAVTAAYFTSTENVAPACTHNARPYENGNFFDEEVYIKLRSLKLDGMELATLDLADPELGLDERLANFFAKYVPEGVDVLDKVNSYVDFYEDGTFELYLTIDPGVLELANSLIDILDVDVSEFDVVDFYNNVPFCSFNTTYDMYFRELFPGFDLRELKSSIESLSMVGCSLEGIDTESESFRKTAASLKENGTLPSDFRLPENLSLVLRGYYTKEKLVCGEDERTVVYLKMVRTGDDTVPMFCALYDEEERSLLFKIEFTSIRIFFQS